MHQLFDQSVSAESVSQTEDLLNAVIVTGENSHKPFGFDQRFHKGRVGTVVPAIVAGVVTHIALMSNQFLIETGLRGSSTATALLEGICRVYWDVNKDQARDSATMLLTEFLVGLKEP